MRHFFVVIILALTHLPLAMAESVPYPLDRPALDLYLLDGQRHTFTLADLQRIARAAPRHLEPGGWLLLEHGMDQGAPVRALLTEAGLSSVRTERDAEDRERVTLGRLNGGTDGRPDDPHRVTAILSGA